VPAVVGYWQLQEDEDDFLNYLVTTGDIVALPARGVKAKQELSPQPIVQYVRRDNPSQFVFGQKHHALTAEIESKETGGEIYFILAYMDPCLIMYQRGRTRDGNKLGLSNLAAYWTYPDKDGRTLLTKDEDFIKWAKKVFAWVRKHTPEQIHCNGFPYRATKRAKEAATSGAMEAVLY